MKKQALIVTRKQLIDLSKSLGREQLYDDTNQEFLIPIINKEGLSDTWRIE